MALSTVIPPEAARESYRSKGVCRAGAMGGARVVCPRQMRMASTTLGWVIAEMISALPPHFLQRRTSSGSLSGEAPTRSASSPGGRRDRPGRLPRSARSHCRSRDCRPCRGWLGGSARSAPRCCLPARGRERQCPATWRPGQRLHGNGTGLLWAQALEQPAFPRIRRQETRRGGFRLSRGGEARRRFVRLEVHSIFGWQSGPL